MISALEERVAKFGEVSKQYKDNIVSMLKKKCVLSAFLKSAVMQAGLLLRHSYYLEYGFIFFPFQFQEADWDNSLLDLDLNTERANAYFSVFKPVPMDCEQLQDHEIGRSLCCLHWIEKALIKHHALCEKQDKVLTLCIFFFELSKLSFLTLLKLLFVMNINFSIKKANKKNRNLYECLMLRLESAKRMLDSHRKNHLIDVSKIFLNQEIKKVFEKTLTITHSNSYHWTDLDCFSVGSRPRDKFLFDHKYFLLHSPHVVASFNLTDLTVYVFPEQVKKLKEKYAQHSSSNITPKIKNKK
jgi:hypothetical protein